MSTQTKLHSKDNDHHVHFGEEADKFGKDNEILIQQLSDHKLSAHLGFLQIYHRYEIFLPIPLSVWNIDKNSVLEEYKDEKVPNIHCTFLDIKYTDNYANVRVMFNAHKEKLIKEDIYLGTSDHGPIVCITLHARVLESWPNNKGVQLEVKRNFFSKAHFNIPDTNGKGKGTPLLRNGIRCIGTDYESDSESSDWQGFEKLNVK